MNAMPSRPQRFPYIDLLKAGASQLIILHHLAFYGPMSDSAGQLLPGLMSWLSEYGRMAVQVFLVVGGFLAARSLAPDWTPRSFDLLTTVRRRYLKLGIPLMAALALALACAALARQWMTHHSLPDTPAPLQVLAHVLLLQDVLGLEALSAGVWYVAIDFQLFTLLAGVTWLLARAGRRFPGTEAWLPMAVFGLMVASVFHFNRLAQWDSWALYFFGAYGAGALTYWSGLRSRPAGAAWLLPLMLLTLALALWLDYRPRLWVVLGSVVFLALAQRSRLGRDWQPSVVVRTLAGSSYSVFLVHFPVCLLVNAAFVKAGITDPLANLFGMMLAWLASIGVGIAFHALVEGPANASGHAVGALPAGGVAPARAGA